MKNFSKKGNNVERWEQKQRRFYDPCLENRRKHFKAYKRFPISTSLIFSPCPHPMTCPHRHMCIYRSCF